MDDAGDRVGDVLDDVVVALPPVIVMVDAIVVVP
jgi:hypothetical protein